MKFNKIISSFEIMKNCKENCLAGKILIHFWNIFLWLTLFYVVFCVVMIDIEPIKKFYAYLAVMGLVLDFFFMSKIPVVVLDNPFKKKHSYKTDIEEAEKESNNPSLTLGDLI